LYKYSIIRFIFYNAEKETTCELKSKVRNKRNPAGDARLLNTARIIHRLHDTTGVDASTTGLLRTTTIKLLPRAINSAPIACYSFHCRQLYLPSTFALIIVHESYGTFC